MAKSVPKMERSINDEYKRRYEKGLQYMQNQLATAREILNTANTEDARQAALREIEALQEDIEGQRQAITEREQMMRE